MDPLLRAFIEEKNVIEYNRQEFNYKFNSKSTKEEFNIEYAKFLSLCSSVFYLKDRLVTVINSCEIRFKSEVLKHIISLYLYAKNNNLNWTYVKFLDTFLWTNY